MTFTRQCEIDAVDQRRREVQHDLDRRRFVAGVAGADAISAQRQLPRPMTASEARPSRQNHDLTFERLHHHPTIMSQLRQRCKVIDIEPEPASKPLRRRRLKSAPPTCSEANLSELRQRLERREQREGPIRHLTRDTYASSLKRKDRCHFCESQADLAEHWNGGCCWCKRDEMSEEHVVALVQRLSNPTNATKGGLPPCDKADPNWLIPIIGYTDSTNLK